MYYYSGVDISTSAAKHPSPRMEAIKGLVGARYIAITKVLSVRNCTVQ